MRRIKFKLFLIFLWAFSASAQNYTLNDGDTVQIRLSSREINRVLVEGGRINMVWGATGVLETKADKDNGEIYIKPTENAEDVFSFFIRDDQGFTYTIIASQSDIPSQTIRIKPKVKVIKSSKFKNAPYVLHIKQMIKEMALGSSKTEYKVFNHDEKITLWKDVQIKLQKSYVSKDLSGEVYSIKNVSKNRMRFDESEFLGFGSDVKAVSLKKLELEPNESSNLYVVRGSNG